MQSKNQEQHTASKKNILFIITKSNFGGAQKYVYELATSLPESMFTVSVALGGNGILKEKLESKNISVISIPHLDRDISIIKEFQVFIFLYKLFKKEQFDIAHLNSSKIGGIGGLAARLARVKKIIFTAHGWAFNENRSFISKLIIKISYFVTMLLCTKTIAVSQQIKAQVARWPLLQKRIAVIHNGVKDIHFAERDVAKDVILNLTENLDSHICSIDNKSREKKLDKDTLWIGTLAELHHIKGLDILFHAIAALKPQHPTINLIIFGEGEERKNLELLLDKLQLRSNVTLLGFVDDASRYLKALDIFVLPSRSEALSLAVLEAGLAELPVVATRVGGIPEIIASEDYGLLVEKENVNELVTALDTMIVDAQYRNTAAQHLRKKVTEEFSHTEMIRKTKALY